MHLPKRRDPHPRKCAYRYRWCTPSGPCPRNVGRKTRIFLANTQERSMRDRRHMPRMPTTPEHPKATIQSNDIHHNTSPLRKMGDLKRSKYLFVAIDYFTKWEKADLVNNISEENVNRLSSRTSSTASGFHPKS